MLLFLRHGWWFSSSGAGQQFPTEPFPGIWAGLLGLVSRIDWRHIRTMYATRLDEWAPFSVSIQSL